MLSHQLSYPADAYENGIQSKVVEPRRVPAACLDPTIKCGNYLPNILARRELERHGMLEGVQRAVEGHVVGGAVSNVFLIQGRRLRTPDRGSGILPGITRAALIEVAGEAGLDVSEERLQVDDLYSADEMFFANTLMECLPVAAIDGRAFAPAPGELTRALHRAFHELLGREAAS
jgi:branched-chain amino acid aminotransferase